jgi:anti-anti-sigma factor
MQVTAHQISSVLVLALDGELTRPVAPAFLRTARQLLGPVAPPLMAVDLTHVPHVDASGFGALVTLLRDVEHRQGSLCLVGLCPEVRLLLEIMQLHLLFEVCLDMDEAVGELVRSGRAPAFPELTRQRMSHPGDPQLLRQAS